MPLPNFMLRDVVGSVAAVFAFSVVLFAPGYLVASATNIFGFRRLRFAEQSLWAIACSFCVVPIAAHLVGRLFGLTGVCFLFVFAAIAALPLLLRRGSIIDWTAQEKCITASVLAAWTALVILLLVDLQIDHKLYYSVVMADQSYRIAFTNAVVHTGIPPANPLYFAGSPAPMRYYYFWYVLCAAIVKLAHVSARQAFIASSIWAAIGLTAAVRLYSTNFFRWTRKTSWIAMGLLLVTGADLLPALGNLVLQSSLNGNTEWWSVDQIDAWPDSLLWVPHHVASVLCCIFAFLLLWRLIREEATTNRTGAIIIAASAYASAFGLSVYVASGFAILMACWLARSFKVQESARAVWLRYLAITVLACVALLAPFLYELLHIDPLTLAHAPIKSTVPKHFLWFSVRPLIDSSLITSLPAFSALNRAHPYLFDQVVRLVLLLPGLAMELGVYGVVLLFLLLAKRRNEPIPNNDARDAAVFLSISGLVMTMFISSSVITNNDFGYRAVMLPQFFLLLLTADIVGSWGSSENSPVIRSTIFRRRLVHGSLWLGVAGSLYWAVLLRAWLPIEASRPTSGFSQSPDDAFQVREASGRLNGAALLNAVVAFRDMDLDAERKDMEVMTPTEFFQRMLVMDIGRQILNAETKCATHFGGDPSACAGIKEATLHLYSLPTPSAAWAQDYCKRLGVSYIVLSARDPAWSQPDGWAANLPVVAAEPRMKILQCQIPSSH